MNRSPLVLIPAVLVVFACTKGGNGAPNSAPVTPTTPTPPLPGAFTQVGDLNQARYAHTATLLTTGAAAGQVLVAGGQIFDAGSGGLTASLERFDPGKGGFVTAGSLASPRSSHTATRLSDGRVLLAGGVGPAGVLASAELYDPVSGGVTPVAGTLAVPRVFHTAVLLTQGPQAGKVLIGGGKDAAGAALSSLELFDPVTGAFTLLPATMAMGRVGHTATLLTDGRVLFAGGQTSGAVETYQPATGVIVVLGSMVQPRSWHTATLMAGNKLLLAGGLSGSTLAGAELCDLSASEPTFKVVGPMLTPRRNHMAALLANGRVLLAGGSSTPTLGSDLANAAEQFDASTGAFFPAGNLNEPVRDGSLTPLPDGSVLVAGGMEWLLEPSPTASLYR